MPGIKPTKLKHFERVKLCCELLTQGLTDTEIKTTVAEKYGISRWTVHRYLPRARNLALEMMKSSKPTQKSCALKRYFAIYRDWRSEDDGGPTWAARMTALKAIDDILGLREPIIIRDQNQIDANPVVWRNALHEMIALSRGLDIENGNGSNGNGNGKHS